VYCKRLCYGHCFCVLRRKTLISVRFHAYAADNRVSSSKWHVLLMSCSPVAVRAVATLLSRWLLHRLGQHSALSAIADVPTCVVPRTLGSYGYRTFAAAGPRLWNSLPVQLRNPDITQNGLFKRQLKGHLFSATMNAALCYFWYATPYPYLLTYLGLLNRRQRHYVFRSYVRPAVRELSKETCKSNQHMSCCCWKCFQCQRSKVKVIARPDALLRGRPRFDGVASRLTCFIPLLAVREYTLRSMHVLCIIAAVKLEEFSFKFKEIPKITKLAKVLLTVVWVPQPLRILVRRPALSVIVTEVDLFDVMHET